MLVFWSRKGLSVTSNWTILDLGFPSDWANWVFSPYLHGDDPGSALEFLMLRACCWCFLDMLLSGCLSNSSVSRLFASLSGNEVHVFSFSLPLFWGSFFVWWKNPNSLFSSLFHPFWCQLSSVTVRSAHYWHGWTGCVVTCVLSLLRWVLKPDVVDLVVEFLHWSSWVHLLIGLVFLLLYHWNYAVSFASR